VNNCYRESEAKKIIDVPLKLPSQNIGAYYIMTARYHTNWVTGELYSILIVFNEELEGILNVKFFEGSWINHTLFAN
jgi:hypothetical protein